MCIGVRRAVLIDHLAVAKPALKLLFIGLLHQLLVDRRCNIVYTMDEAVLHRASGQLEPGTSV